MIVYRRIFSIFLVIICWLLLKYREYKKKVAWCFFLRFITSFVLFRVLNQLSQIATIYICQSRDIRQWITKWFYSIFIIMFRFQLNDKYIDAFFRLVTDTNRCFATVTLFNILLWAHHSSDVPIFKQRLELNAQIRNFSPKNWPPHSSDLVYFIHDWFSSYSPSSNRFLFYFQPFDFIYSPTFATIKM